MDLNDALMLPFIRVDQLKPQPQKERWLIDRLWVREAVGLLGGAPKLGKSWLGLEMAVSVASGTACLGRFEVHHPGPVLVYLAEDGLADVRARIEALCAHRQIAIKGLNLFTITASSVRLDLLDDQKRLRATLSHLRPHLLVLDPLVRMHRLDENSSADISRILGYLRELQRQHHLAIMLVHHASKRQHAQPGQALRGSSDLHAFGDSNAYLARKQDQLVLTLEHRAAKAIDPIELELVCDATETAVHLKVISTFEPSAEQNLAERIQRLLKDSSPLKGTFIRSQLKVNNQRLGQALIQLQNQGVITRQPQGWCLAKNGEESLLPDRFNRQTPYPLSVDALSQTVDSGKTGALH